MQITINTHHCSREELAELKEYLENNSWDFKTDEPENEPEYLLREGGIYIIGSHFEPIDERISEEELHEYSIIHRESFLDELIRWISEANSDKQMMKDDLMMLSEWDDDYIFSSNSTNSYIGKNCSEFNSTCKELIELNKTI